MPGLPYAGGKFKGTSPTSELTYISIKWLAPQDTAFNGDYEAKLLVHVAGPGGGDILSSNTVNFSIGAAQLAVVHDPAKNVKLNDTGIEVAWTSAVPEDGYLEWTLNEFLTGTTSTIMTTTDDRGSIANRLNLRTHKATISGIAPAVGNVVHYRIVSGDGTIGNIHSVTIPGTGLVTPPSNITTGRITYQGGALGAECNVSVRVSVLVPAVTTLHSLWTNVVAGPDGFYSVDLTNIRQDPSNGCPGRRSCSDRSPGNTSTACRGRWTTHGGRGGRRRGCDGTPLAQRRYDGCNRRG